MKITGLQLFYMQVVIILSTVDVFLPSIIAKDSGPDAWLAILIAFIFGIFMAWIYGNILNKIYPDNMTTFLKKRGFAGKILLCLYFYLYFILTVVVMREISELMLVFLPQTPMLAISLLMQLVIFYGLFSGVATMAKATEVLAPIGIGALAIVAGYALTKTDFGNFKPILANGFFPVVKGSFDIINFFGDTLVLLFFAANLFDKPQKLFRIFILGYFVITIALLGGVLGIGVFGAKTAASMEMIALEMVRIVNIADFLKNLDSIMLGVWAIGGVLKLTFFYFGLLEILKVIANVKNIKLHALPLGIIGVMIALYGFKDLGEFFSYLGLLTYFTLIFSLLIPIIIVFRLRSLQKGH